MLDSGVTTDGRFLIIEEFVSAHTLAECLDSNGFYFEERMKVALQLADALTYIHAQGIMHRDVKSANVLVDVDAVGTFTTVKLSDFGLAKGVQEREVGGTRFSSRVCGTTGYMDPECLRGEGRCCMNFFGQSPEIGRACIVYITCMKLYARETDKSDSQ